MKRLHYASPIFASLLLLAACSESTPPTGQSEPEAETADAETSTVADAPAIPVPTGTYALDPTHASLSFTVNHLGLSNYVARFADYDVQLVLDPENPGKSSVKVTVDPTSIRTDYPGDYKATHQESPYQSWNEDLAQSPKFFNAGEFAQISFESTKVEQRGPGAYHIVGDLSMLGVTRPLELNASIVGATEKHPFTGKAAIGFSAQGTLQRSAFGMNHLLQPPLIGDAVTVRFEGEFQQAD
ncbi:MAG: YceI family protein [Panacagrimonas sp.]